MQYQKSFFDDEDDIDKLLSHLQIIEPPPSFISRVLNSIPANELPLLLFPQPVAWNNLDKWLMHNRRQQWC